MGQPRWSQYTSAFMMAAVIGMLAGCGGTTPIDRAAVSSSTQAEASVSDDSGILQGDVHPQETPELRPVALDAGEKLRVVATTGIVADVVRNVGGDAIDLAQLMPAGADPHSYTPTPQDLRTLNDAHVVFMNGLGLEEALLPVLENLDRPIPLLSVNAGTETLQLASGHEELEDEHEGEDEHDHGGVDPHTWFSVPIVMMWADNITAALGELDPMRSEAYLAGAASYKEQLEELDAELRMQIDALPEENRKLVIDHVALAYLAGEYGFTEVGAIVPSLSTLAAASAQELAALQEAMQAEGVKAVFVSTTVNAQTAEQMAGDLGIPVVKIFTGSLSDRDGPASTYIDLMRYDVARIVEALR